MVETTQKIKEDKAFNEEYMIHSRQNSQNDLVKNNYIDGPIKLTKKPKENHVKLLNIFKSKLKVFSKIAKETRHESTKKTTTKDSSYSLNDIDNKNFVSNNIVSTVNNIHTGAYYMNTNKLNDYDSVSEIKLKHGNTSINYNNEFSKEKIDDDDLKLDSNDLALPKNFENLPDHCFSGNSSLFNIMAKSQRTNSRHDSRDLPILKKAMSSIKVENRNKLEENGEAILDNYSSISNNNVISDIGDLYTVEVKDYNSYSVLDLSKKLIHTATVDTTVILPPIHIVIPFIRVTIPIKIKGTPGSTLEIANGNILINITENFKSSKLKKFIICECSIIFTIDCNKFKNNIINKSDGFYVNLLKKENTVEIPLINVRDKSVIELRDSSFNSLINYSVSENLPYQLLDIGVCICLDPEIDVNKIVFINACSFTSFYNALKCNDNARILVEKSNFHKIQSNIIITSNPLSLIVKNCVLNKSKGTAITIQYMKSSVDISIIRKIEISDNEILSNTINGVMIFYEGACYLNNQNPIELKLSNNLLMFNSYCGLKLSNIMKLTLFHCNTNDIQLNSMNGIEVNDCVGILPFLFMNNIISSNRSNGLEINNSGSIKFTNNMFSFNLNGVLINNNDPLLTRNLSYIFEKDTFRENFGNGIKVSSSRTIFHLLSCQFEANHKYGLSILNNSKSIKKLDNINIERCVFFSNYIAGLYLENVFICFNKSVIGGNEKYSLECKETKIRFINYENENFRSLICGELKGYVEPNGSRLCNCINNFKCILF